MYFRFYFPTYPVNCAEVDSFSKIETLIKATVISSWKCNHKFTSTLVGSVNLGQTRQRKTHDEL